MDNITLFDNIEETDIKKMLKCFNSKKRAFKKDSTALSNIRNTNLIGIILKGTANLVKYDYNGNRTIIEKLSKDSVFGEAFSSNNGEMSLITTSPCEILFIDYAQIITRCKKNCPYHTTFIDNMLQLLATKIINMNERIDILAKRSIRDKLLAYFDITSRNRLSKTFTLSFSYTDLADYLSIDRSAMMRELKNLRDEGFIETKGKRISLKY